MVVRLLLAAAVAHVALAYSNTSPLVAWSSSGSLSLEALSSQLGPTVHSLSLIESIFNGEDVCGHDAVILVAQPGLHSSDLRTLPPHSRLARSLASTPSARQFPYVPSYSSLDIADLGDQLAAKCNSRFVYYPAGVGAIEDDRQIQHGKKHVVCLSMPDLDQSGRARKEAMNDHESLLSSDLASLAATFPNHLVVYTGSTPSSHMPTKRQSSPTPDRPILDLSEVATSTPKSASAAANTTLPEGGILKRYQLLTPALITGLLVAFFLLVPVLYFALGTLASIQIPIRSDVGKTFSALEKKNQ
ncbi:hypothetical protein HYPSUDRAFT_140237 [Hypholoma sublateritium FD-334 SS-4]|uniref:Protein BIG1 n=1 Tax=Hypholoma sublateritium (strain FD-334 SS-4) TaxID=945553 RepID=A0A0D2NZ08_HYPSF|nr:hypothetical protein HYPSUDRAFT_140237 [Hypholoma sublateritium FD-334 SS-4]